MASAEPAGTLVGNRCDPTHLLSHAGSLDQVFGHLALAQSGQGVPEEVVARYSSMVLGLAAMACAPWEIND